jgi:methylenetetrahydrofolate dehydrogenase (NADP+)/methenyltetrahydrofolate cyclohydrolase
VRPGLAVVLVGDNPASELYVRNKVRACEKLGIYSEKLTPPATISTAELLDVVGGLNARDEIDGILVQLPLPAQVDTRRVLMAVDPAKDVDGFHPVNVGNLVAQRSGLLPCTPAGILEILQRSQIPIAGQRVVVVGRSDIVGKPVALLLLHQHATVTICHSRTGDLAAVTRQADILVAAIGRAEMITSEFVKPGATVIDVGSNKVGDRWTGDVHFASASQVAGAITPVPGGVGPLTIAMLMHNTLKACRARRGKQVPAEAVPA